MYLFETIKYQVYLFESIYLAIHREKSMLMF